MRYYIILYIGLGLLAFLGVNGYIWLIKAVLK
jgi:hypothetical protein